MSLVWFARNNAGEVVEITQRVQFLPPANSSAQPGTDGMTGNAEEGSVARTRIRVDDPDGTFDVSGFRIVSAVETEAADDDFAGVIDGWYTNVQEVVEGHPWDGTGRVWIIDLDDINSVLDRRMMRSAGSDRRAIDETDVERVQWLEATTEMSLIDSDDLISAEDPVDMDGADLRHRRPREILDDCANQAQKNWFVIALKNPSEPTETLFTLWYGKDNLDTFPAGLRISNVPGDQDENTFVPNQGASLKRDPTRVYSGIVGEYKGGSVYRQRPATSEAFALNGRDTSVSMQDLSTQAKASARADRMLDSIKTQEHVITVSIDVPAARVNDLHRGHAVDVRFSWMPDYAAGFTTGRVLNRTVVPLNRGLYRINATISVPPPEPPTPSVAQHVEHESPNSEPGGLSTCSFLTPPGDGSIIVALFGWGIDTDIATWPPGWTEIAKVHLDEAEMIGGGYGSLRWKESEGEDDQHLIIDKGSSVYSYTAMVELTGVTSIVDTATADNVADSLPPTPSIGPVTGTAADQIAVGFMMIAGINNWLTPHPDWLQMENGQSGASPTFSFCTLPIGSGEDLTLTGTSNTTGAHQDRSAGVLVVWGA